jgi:hypothetical protein
VAVLLVGVFAGCGDGRPRRVPVSGQVLIDGKPLRCGYVRVLPEKSRAATGTIDKQGRFQLTTFDPGDGCVPGTHPVEVFAAEKAGPSAVRWLIPKDYQDEATSGLTVTIKEPTDSLVIKLSWKGGQPFVEQLDTRGDDGDPTRETPGK